LEWEEGVPLPFALPALSSGLAALSPGSAQAGADIAAAAAQSVGALLGCAVQVTGRVVPGRPAPRASAGQVALDLAALPGAALLEVEAALVVALVDRLAGGEGRAGPAARLTPVEAAALDLLALAAIDGVCQQPGIEAALAPRLATHPGSAFAPAGALAVELTFVAGPASGRGRLLIPAAAVRALAREDGALAAPELRVCASLRTGSARLAERELGGLGPGDVVVMDGGEVAALVLPGGVRFTGRLGGEGFSVDTEADMDGRNQTIPIALEVELGRVEVTLGELGRLGPGAVLPLGLDRSGRVALKAGERTVARGELVDVEGAVGVRILEVLP
jgi:type III secretion protein Q